MTLKVLLSIIAVHHVTFILPKPNAKHLRTKKDWLSITYSFEIITWQV